jgi:hypothetical protein
VKQGDRPCLRDATRRGTSTRKHQVEPRKSRQAFTLSNSATQNRYGRVALDVGKESKTCPNPLCVFCFC